MSFLQSIQDYFTGPTEKVSTVLPSGETIYENNYSKKVSDNYQSVLDYNYFKAQQPNPEGFLTPQYDRTNLYDKDSPESRKNLLKMTNQSSLFQTNFQGNETPQTRDANVMYSELSGMPLTMGTGYLEKSIPMTKSKQSNMENVENPSWARKMEFFGNNDMYSPKVVSKWSDFHADITENVNGVPIYSQYDLQRAKDTFSMKNEMTNIPPTPQIRVPRRIDGEIRALPRTIDETRATDNVKVGGVLNKNMNVNASSKVSALPMRFSTTKDLRKKQVKFQAFDRNTSTKNNDLYNTTQSKQTKKEQMIFQYVGNPKAAVENSPKRDGIFSKHNPNRIMYMNYQGLSHDTNGKFIDNRNYYQKSKRQTSALSGSGQFLMPLDNRQNIQNSFNLVSNLKNKRVYETKPLFGTVETTLDVWKPNLQHKRHVQIENKRLYN